MILNVKDVLFSARNKKFHELLSKHDTILVIKNCLDSLPYFGKCYKKDLSITGHFTRFAHAIFLSCNRTVLTFSDSLLSLLKHLEDVVP